MGQIMIQAIPTVYAKVQFRSRLEAKWACFFDKCGWQWAYEPVDLDGYIPDFFLDWPAGQVLVEVKPNIPSDDLTEVYERIQKSGWEGTVVILCSTWDQHGALSVRMGAVGEGDHYDAWGDLEDALLVRCGGCHGPAIWACADWPRCLRCACRTRLQDNESPPESSLPVSVFHLREKWWAESGNEVQWKKPE